METMNQIQYDSLVGKISELLMSDPGRGLGDTGDCWDAAIETVDEWIEENNITINF